MVSYYAMKKDTPFTIAGRTFSSRLLVGSGKYKDLEETRLATEKSGSEIITVAIRRTNIGQNPNEESLLDVISPEKYTILPNTAGCYNAKDAVRTCLLARELLDGHNLVKLEVLGDEKTLYPNIVETLEATKVLINEGFDVMVYTSDDPIVAKELTNILYTHTRYEECKNDITKCPENSVKIINSVDKLNLNTEHQDSKIIEKK